MTHRDFRFAYLHLTLTNFKYKVNILHNSAVKILEIIRDMKNIATAIK